MLEINIHFGLQIYKALHPHEFIKRRSLGLPWQSSDCNSVLPLQGVGLIPGGVTKISHAVSHGHSKINK